jgi:hypothetical protein
MLAFCVKWLKPFYHFAGRLRNFTYDWIKALYSHQPSEFPMQKLMCRLGLVLPGLVLPLSIGAIALPAQATQTATEAKTSESPKYPYPADAIEAYVSSCSKAGQNRIPRAIMTEICSCTIEEFQNQFSFKEFRAIGEGIQKGKDIPPEMTRTMESCVQQVIAKPNV